VGEGSGKLLTHANSLDPFVDIASGRSGRGWVLRLQAIHLSNCLDTKFPFLYIQLTPNQVPINKISLDFYTLQFDNSLLRFHEVSPLLAGGDFSANLVER
jgi:hypothetical protein